jgi:hypothetical protein
MISKSLIFALIALLIIAIIAVLPQLEFKKMVSQMKPAQKKDIQTCKQMADFNERTHCLIAAYADAKDINICKEIQEFHPENVVHCYAQIAANTNNPALCDELATGWNQQCVWQYKEFIKIKSLQTSK